MAEKNKKVAKKNRRYNPKTAADVAAGQVDNVAADDAAFAEQEGAIAAAYVDYDEALQNYEARSDVETLASRRAREVGYAFEDNSHRRQAGEEAVGAITTASVEAALPADQKSGPGQVAKDESKDSKDKSFDDKK